MSKTNAIFQSQPVNIPNISGHDMSHEHLTSMMFGTLHPTLCMEVMPDTTIDAGFLTNVSLPPFAAKFNGKVDLKTEAFFVPFRILWGGWKNFASQKNQTIFNGSVPQTVPYMNLNDFSHSESGVYHLAPFNTTFLQQLGYDMPLSGSYVSRTDDVNIFPLLAYHRIWADWYRDPRLQQNPFTEATADELIYGALPSGAGAAPQHDTLWRSPWVKDAYSISPYHNESSCDYLLADLYSVFCPRPRLWAKDYFTTAIPSPVQAGVEQHINVVSGSITISAIRAANALQKYAEKLAAVGDRYEDIEAATYGVRPSDAVLDRPLLLGSSSKPLYTVGIRSMYEPKDLDATKANPYQYMFGAETGKIESTDGMSIANNFTTTERGIIIVMQSIVPHAYYDNIFNKDVKHLLFTDFGNPEFASVGRVPIYTRELGRPGNNNIFGYADRYSEYKFRNDRVTGQMCTGKFLDYFALKRPIDASPTLSSDFLEMRPDVMDGVLAYTPALNTKRVAAWTFDDDFEVFHYSSDSGNVMYTIDQPEREFEVDTYFDMRVTNTLPVFTIPSLEGPKGDTRLVPKAGTRIQ